jgi:hypothetical protein
MDVLHELSAACRVGREWRDGYVRPMDCGGSNGSHHGATLRKLVERGYAERRGHRYVRRTNYYRITATGLVALQNWLDRRKKAR